MKTRFLLNMLIALFTLSCSESEDQETKCETYFLSLIGTLEAHYNSHGLISEYISGSDTIAKFEYNADKQLASRETGALHVYYYYDETKRLEYIIEYDGEEFRDSITFIFDSQNLITSIKYHTYVNFELTPTRIIEYEYIGKNSNKARIYLLDNDNIPNLKLSSTVLYEFDTKKIPFPKETWPFYYVSDNGSISENNVIKQTLKRDGFPDTETTYTYKYNSDGYPIQMESILPTIHYSYSCEPKLRGTD